MQLVAQNNAEIDVIIYLVKYDNGIYYGITSNLTLVCITMTKDVQQSFNENFGSLSTSKNTENGC